ncbi:melibiose:sodium transporter MelB [uncultured Anaerococcus sp.]|uniref:melibiose:sodium transporter MelB n=1 Tax=uncultured Anaerococcus sp. TaxID=293428 RepID=UPI00261DFF7C|nr:melibiose:sodium transporter MelB [uncultured Anaerococcus sp.]
MEKICVCLIFYFCMLYYTDVLHISAGFVGTLFFLAKFWDAINDLAMGMIVDNTRSKWGKFRPWLVIGTLVNSVVLIIMFSDWGLKGVNLYVFASVMYVLWGMTYTIMDIPYWSMIPNLTSDPKERDKVAVIPRIFASLGGLLVAGFGLQMVDYLGKGDQQIGFTRFAWVVAIIFIVTIGITVKNVTSADKIKNEKSEKITFTQVLRVIRQNDQLLVAVATILAFNFAMQCIGGVQTYYFIYVAGNKGLFSVFTIFAGLAEMFGLLIYPKISENMSKKQVYLLASGVPVLGLILLLIIGYVSPQSYVLTALAGILVKLGSGLQLGTVTVVLADVVDYGEYKLGTRNESVVFSTQTLLVKFASAIGALFTGFALDLTGYVPNAVQSLATLNGIRLIMIGIPVVFVMISFLIFKKHYKLNSTKMQEVMAKIS